MSDEREQDQPSPIAASDPASEERSEEALLRRFIGRNPEKLLKVYKKQRQGKFANSMNWVVFFLGWHTWFFYRKMYLYGIAGFALLLGLVALLELVAPQAATAGSAAANAMLAFYANVLYVRHARRKIGAIEQHAIPEADRDRMIEKAGGVSWAGAVLGVGIVVAIAGAVVYEVVNSPRQQVRQAGCASDIVHETALELVVNVLAEQGLPTDGIDVVDFVEVPSPSPTTIKTCRFIGRQHGETATFYLKIDPLEGDPDGVYFNLSTRPD